MYPTKNFEISQLSRLATALTFATILFVCSSLSVASSAESSNAEPSSANLVESKELSKADKSLKDKFAKQVKNDPCQAAQTSDTLAAYYYAQEKYSPSISSLNKALELLANNKCATNSLSHASIKMHIGDCKLRLQDARGAITYYKESLAEQTNTAGDDLTGHTLDGLSNAYKLLEDYSSEQEYLQKLLLLQQKQNSPSVGWTYLSLKDCYEHQGKQQDAESMFDLAVSSFRKIVDSPEAAAAPSEPATVPLSLWSALEQQQRITTPAAIWHPTSKAKPWAVILCIHGMGLHKHSFDDFAQRLAPKGVLVVAMDVRGFGSWSKSQASKELNFSTCSSDVKHVSRILAKLNPGVPIYLLGESMGGAIVLQSSLNNGHIAGVISSVPAAERFKGGETAVKVAISFVTRPGQGYDITKDVVEESSRDKKVIEGWQKDKDARFVYASEELIKFNDFMKRTKGLVQGLELPVLVTQGAKDPLVKPHSTIELFEAIKSKDKTLLYLGDREHLIFENNQFSNLLIEGLITWLQGHSKVTPVQPSGSP